ncbi:MAG TPA: Xaa-Pro peptidase family protein [Spirochaetota bacterium]|nr:Xaa-Pro peptidase family protein [Spirochaetota bacterium]
MKLKRFREIASGRDVYPYLIFDLKNIRYLTGFEGSNAFLLIYPDKAFFITDSRYEEYAGGILTNEYEFVLQEKSFYDTLSRVISEGEKNLYLEEHSASFSNYNELKKKFPQLKIESGGSIVNELRAVKNADEIEKIRKAVKITDECFSHLLSTIRPGITEWDIVMEAEIFSKMKSARRMAFDTIAASGKNSSMPHYFPSPSKILQNGENVLIDMGCEFEGYNSDLTRTVFLGEIPEELRKIYSVVLESQRRAISAAKPGMSAGELDAVARDYISANGFGSNFGHSLGHGVGLDVHEAPAVKGGGEMILKSGMVITVEPGIYVQGCGGVRIEDVILIREEGAEILTSADKDIIII